MAAQPRTVSLRGYTKRLPNGRYVSVCVTLNLVAEGPSATEARANLDALENAYLLDAAKNDEWDEFVPRRAPLEFYAEYALAWFLRIFRGININTQFSVFKDTSRPFRAHA